MTKKVKVSDLILDFALYPRADVDAYNVSRLVEALEGGAMLPAIIIDGKSFRVIDGFHRVRAFLKVFGADYEIECEVRTYKNEKEMLLDAIRCNSHHGRAMSSYDRARAMSKALEFGAQESEIAEALGIVPDRLSKIMEHRFSAASGKAGPQALKCAVKFLSGKKLTKDQIAAMPKLGGWHALGYVNQVHLLIDNGMIDWANVPLMESLARLGEKITALGIKVEAA